ncbi:hypothetical protein T10_8434 [Trichinella papuae]|uniref:Uncharacterized protein n=1 Tax=Trichinella papuae TaxID=268474 RepID=A0A0V1MIR3_9BILA|nr:hypothetical protein T10_8434 [Trichinella papuae]
MVDTWLFAHETTVSYCRQVCHNSTSAFRCFRPGQRTTLKSQSVIRSNKRTTTILIPQSQKPPQKVTVSLDRELHNVQV